MLNFAKRCWMLAKQALTEFFIQENIKTIFHLPGIHTLSFYDSLLTSKIEPFIGRHEANLAFMADGFARASGMCGVLIVTPGPGLGNVVTGCMEAYGDDTPLLILHIDTDRKDTGKGILHELAAPENIFASFTKKIFIVSRKENLVPTLYRAYRTACSERKGPVLVSIPYVYFEKDVPFARLVAEEKAVPAQPDLSPIEEALRGKKRPVIIGGKSLMIPEVRPILDTICRTGSIPFFSTTSGKGTVREDAPYSFGNVMQKGTVKEIIASADVVIAIGTRLRDVDTKRRGVKIRDLIHIDVDDAWMGRNYRPRVATTGDIGKILALLPQVLKGRRFDWHLEMLRAAKMKEEDSSLKSSPGHRIIKLLREVIPEETTMVCDLNLPSYWAEYFFPVYHQNTFITPRGISPIFYALPAAIGAKIGRMDRPCLAICGDGGMLPTVGELSTIKKYNLPVVIFLYNNNSFGILEDYMDQTYGRRGSMNLSNPDFIKLAGAFGIKGRCVKSLEALRKVFLRDVTWEEPFLVELDYPVFPPPWRA
jgi:acetolactate synthase-1/2/3 large subunit